jgi:beta-lactamase class A
MKHLTLLTLAGVILIGPSPALGTGVDSTLYARLHALVKDFDGEAGIYVRHLSTGETVDIHADSLFPTASLVKVPILGALFERIQAGEMGYHDEWEYRDSLLYPGVDILGSFKDGEKITVAKVVMLMITTSDNTAALWCQSKAGGGATINEWLASNGFEHTRVNSRTLGREADRERLGWGQTTPREISEMLVDIRDGSLVSPAASEEMYRVLTRIYWDDEALSQFPPWVQVASKQGAVSQSRSEVALVNGPSGDFVFSVITNNQSDTRWEHDNAGYVLIRRVARLLWQHFEPESDWQPAEGRELF